MQVSLVELAPVRASGTKHEALAAAVSAATEAEGFGYHRIWYAEHNHTPAFASQDPATLIALAAARTNRIRVGSGAVLLNHYRPFHVAERFQQLEALTPGRIDLGLGRATAGPLVHPGHSSVSFADQLRELLAHQHRGFPGNHPFATVDITAGIGGVPQVWVLGSSGKSAGLAGELRLGYVFAGFINPTAAVDSLRAYRESFAGAGQHRGMLALNIVAADDMVSAHRLTWPARALKQLRLTGDEIFVPTLAQAAKLLSPVAKQQPSHFDGSTIPAQLSGTVESLREQLSRIVELTGATEIMVQDMLVDGAERSRSRELIAAAVTGI
ncbi:Limonene 1,2-monooxygenase [Corynebacterium occultum]|uniref:Limonene 1,2-monooxygenase n=1 Tax=Corynebacterium occultum TaxID=2675219 RepID=A0A6B8W344_9CORY|nr:Limonene 1,2-monooxygenase [Corynebacterium occultum]